MKEYNNGVDESDGLGPDGYYHGENRCNWNEPKVSLMDRLRYRGNLRKIKGEPVLGNTRANLTKSKKKGLGEIIDNFYFNEQSFEKGGEIYEKMGVKQFMKYCQTFHLFKKFPKSKDLLKRLIPATKIYELIHLAGAAVVTPFIANYIVEGKYKEAAIGSVLNLFVNLYPLMAQRRNRFKMEKLVKKLEERE